MQYANGRMITDAERYSGPFRVYLVNIETGVFTLIGEFADKDKGEAFARSVKEPYPMLVLSHSDVLVPIENAVASICSYIKTGNF